MKTLKGSFKKSRKDKKHTLYFLDEVRTNERNYNFRDNYSAADRFEEIRMYEFTDMSTDQKLDHIVSEVKLRTRITKQEIFIIGELLFLAKEICANEKLNYKDWLENKFDFSYETGQNFVHVYEYCLTYRNLAVEVPSSILYKLSMPSMPEELRDFLFKEANLETLSNGKFQRLVKIYHEEGMEAVQREIEGVNKWSRICNQILFNMDIYENALRILIGYKLKIEGGSSKYINRKHSDYTEQIQNNETEAQKINLTLHKAFVHSIEILQNAYNDCHSRALEIRKNLDNKM